MNRLRSTLKPGQDFCQASCQKTCPYGHKESDCCHYTSASSSIMSTILPSITSPPSARMWKKSLQLAMPLSPHRGRMIAFATAVRSGPPAFRGFPFSLDFTYFTHCKETLHFFPFQEMCNLHIIRTIPSLARFCCIYVFNLIFWNKV